MEFMDIESFGSWVKTGKVWTHLATGTQRHLPPDFEIHIFQDKPKKIMAYDIEGVFILANRDKVVYSILIGMGGWPSVYSVDLDVVNALYSFGLVDNPEEI